MLQIRSLQNLEATHLYPVFLRAFADYLVPLRLSEAQFSDMLYRRGFLPALSAGAWQGGELQGFWLSAVFDIDGVDEGYCIMAGVAPAARRQGVLGQLACHVTNLLLQQGIARQRLEVINGNAAAEQAYQQLGYQRQRQLNYYPLHQPIVITTRWTVQQHSPAQVGDWPSRQWCSFPAATPERHACLQRSLPLPLCLTVSHDGQLAGSLLLSAQGQVYELQVCPTLRRQGIASQLLAAAQAQAPGGQLTLGYVDDRDLAMNALLAKWQAQRVLAQWEMLRSQTGT